MPQSLHNTMTRRKDPVVPADPSHVTFYTCGPTVYDDAHIGNFRSFLAADLLRRWLESPLCELTAPDGSTHQGPRTVTHVLNITDVGHMTDDDIADGAGEDKMQAATKRLLKAKSESKKSGSAHAATNIDPNDPRQIAAFYADRFLEDARALGMKVALQDDPSLLPRASDNIDGMRSMIESLAAKGFAYRVGDAAYFDVQKFPDYGSLSGNALEDLKGGAGGRVHDQHQADKHHPADFLLWKSDPSHLMKWPGPTINGVQMEEGYPGWHIECSVMSLARLDPNNTGQVDIHSGGEDNIFPHHECENAQSRCVTGTKDFARHWFHPRFLMYEGAKMSKSKGTFFTARDLFSKGIEPAALRLELIKSHYRTNANFTEQGLKDSQRMIDRWRRFTDNASGSSPDESTRDRCRNAFAQAMHDDLNIAGALGSLNTWISDTPNPSTQDAALLNQLDDILGILSLPRPTQAQTSIGVFTGGLEPNPAVIELLEQRAKARANKDFPESDRIRDELASMGLSIKDIAGAKVEVSRAPDPR